MTSDNYAKASKIIETFGLFIEKLSISSSSPIKNTSSLLQFKQILYNNLNSQPNILSSLSNCYGEPFIIPKDLPKLPPLLSKPSLDLPYSLPKSHDLIAEKPKSGSDSEVEKLDLISEKLEGRQMPSQDGFSDKLQEQRVLITEYVTVSQLMPRIKAASHNEITKLFALGTAYSNARTFSEHQCPVLAALCFCFFEKLLQTKAKDFQSVPPSILETQINNDPELYGMRGTELFGFIKGLLQNFGESEVSQKLFDHAAANPKVYRSTVAAFKRLVLENLPRKVKNSETETLEWMNEIDTADAVLLQGLTRLLRVSVKFLILTKEKLFERIAYTEELGISKYDSPRDKIEHTILYDKGQSSAYILYPVDKGSDDGSRSPSKQRGKFRPSANSRQDIAGMGNEEEKEEFKPVSKHLELPRKTHSHHEGIGGHDNGSSYSTPMARDGSVSGKPSFDKGPAISPRSGSKDTSNRYHHTRDLEALEERLTPKEKDIAPPRPSSHLVSHVNAVAEEKFTAMLTEKSKNVMIMENGKTNYSGFEGRQYSAHKMGKDEGKAFTFGRSATQEYSSGPSSAGVRMKAEMLGQRGQSSEAVARHPSGKVQETVVNKPTRIPENLQGKIDKIMERSSYCEEEFDELVNKYLKKPKGGRQEHEAPKKGLGMLTQAYQNILGQNKENNYYRASTGQR